LVIVHQQGKTYKRCRANEGPGYKIISNVVE
jgi:hypothetical protein